MSRRTSKKEDHVEASYQKFQREQEANRRTWNKRAFKFAEDGDYDTARANLEQAAAIRT